MRLLALVLFLLTLPACSTKNTFSGAEDSDYTAEEEATEQLSKGNADKAEKILRRQLSVTLRENLEIGDFKSLKIAVVGASEKEIERTLPLLATAYAEKQKVGVGEFLKNIAENSEGKDSDSLFVAVGKSLPSDPLAAEEDIRKCRDVAQALVSTKANTSGPVALTALTCTLADFGNRMNKVSHGQPPSQVDNATVDAISRQDIDEIYSDLEESLALSARMKEAGSEQAGKLNESMQRISDRISSSKGGDDYDKFRNYLRKN